MLRRRIGVLLLSVTWIAVTTPSPSNRQNVRPTRQLDFGECCPCTGAGAGKLAHTELDALPDSSAAAAVMVPSVGRGAGECPCCQRDIDSLGAASGPVPSQVRAARPFMMPRPASDPKEEGKPLLHPEVGLASSVLETLREATDEEYQDALERDAARSAAADENSSEASRKIVTIILNPTTQSTERVDDSDVAGTHMQESRCIHSPLESSRTVSQLQAPQNLLEDIVGVPRFQPSGLLKGKTLLLDENPGASEVRESFVSAPAQSKPPLLKLLADDKLHLDKHGVRDLIKVYKMSKDILDENNTLQTSDKSSQDAVRSSSVPDFGINSKISDLNERIDQLNYLNELTKIPQLKIDGKYSKVAKGVEILESTEEITNAESLQAPSDREDTASPASDTQTSDVSNFRVATNQLKTLNEAILQSVPDLVTKAKKFLKLKDEELIISKVANATAKASQTNIPNFKLLTIDELISRAKAINLKNLIPAVVSSTTPGPIINSDLANDAISNFTKKGQIPKYDFDDNTQDFETEIIDAVPSPSVNQVTITENASEGAARASADGSECKAVFSEKTFKEPQVKSVVGNSEEIMNQEFKETSENVARQGHFSNESDDDSELESSNSADRSMDVDRGTGIKLANKLERLSDKLKKSEHKSKFSNTNNTNRKETKDASVAESRHSTATKSLQNDPQMEDSRSQASALLEDPRPSGNSQPDSQAREQNNSNVRSDTAEDLPMASLPQKQTKAKENNMAAQALDTAADMCKTNDIEKKYNNLLLSENAEMSKEASQIITEKKPLKAKFKSTKTVLNKPKPHAKSKEAKNGLAKKDDMAAAGSERAYNFFDNHLRRPTTMKPNGLPRILNRESNLQAPGPWTLWSGPEHDRTNTYPHLSPEKFRDFFEGLSRTRGNNGMTGGDDPAFPERRSQLRSKSPFGQENVPTRLFPLSFNEAMSGVRAPVFPVRLESPGLKSLFKKDKGPIGRFPLSGMTIEEMAPGLPSLDEMRSHVQEYLSSQKLIDTDIPNLGNLRASEPIKQLENFRDNIQKTAENAVSSLQQTLSSTLDVAKVRDENFLASSIYAQPENVLDALSKARFDVDDRLKSIHTNVMDRLSSISDQLSMEPPPVNFPKVPNLKSARMQEKSASENRLRITSPKTPVTRLRSEKMAVGPEFHSRLSGPSAVKEPIRLPPIPKLDLSQLPYLPWDTDGKLGSRNNEKSYKNPTARKLIKADKLQQDSPAKPLPIVRKSMRKPAERTRERTSTTSQRNIAPRPDLRVRPLQPTPAIRRTQFKRPSKTSQETGKWKMALATTPSPRTNTIPRLSTPVLKSSLGENPSPISKLSFDPNERLRASLQSQRDALGSSSQNIISKTDAINERLKNSLAVHRQKFQEVQENAKSRGTMLKPVVKVNISKMELPERIAFKDPPTGKLQKRDSETEEDETEELENLLNVKPLGKSSNVNDFLDKIKQSVRTTLSTAVLKPKLADNEAGQLRLRPEMMEGASDVFKTMIEKANEPMKENMTYQCTMVCNKE